MIMLSFTFVVMRDLFLMKANPSFVMLVYISI